MTVLNSDLLARIAKRLDVSPTNKGERWAVEVIAVSNKSTSAPDDNSKK